MRNFNTYETYKTYRSYRRPLRSAYILMQPECNPASIEHMLTVGRGGAIIFLLGTDTSPYREMILDHCLHDKAYDTQIEDSRACYLYPLIRRSPDRDFYRDAILQALRDADDESSVSQLFDFAVMFARDGDEGARFAIREKFDKHDLREIYPGATSLIEIDGIDGLLHVLDYMGSDSDVTDRYNNAYHFIYHTEDRLGEEVTRKALADAYEKNANIRIYLASISEQYTPSSASDDIAKSHIQENLRKNQNEKISSMTWQEIRRSSNSEQMAMFWSRSASDDELVEAANDIIYEKDSLRLSRYLRIFTKRQFPLNPKILIDFINNSNSRVSNAALQALTLITNEDIRALFECLVQSPEWSDSAVGLLRSNYREGDHLIIEKLLEQENDVHQLHSLSCELLDVYKHNPDQNAAKSLLFVYENNPCSHCRLGSVEQMRALDQLPDWIVNECVYDAEESLRKMAQELLADNEING